MLAGAVKVCLAASKPRKGHGGGKQGARRACLRRHRAGPLRPAAVSSHGAARESQGAGCVTGPAQGPGARIQKLPPQGGLSKKTFGRVSLGQPDGQTGGDGAPGRDTPQTVGAPWGSQAQQTRAAVRRPTGRGPAGPRKHSARMYTPRPSQRGGRPPRAGAVRRASNSGSPSGPPSRGAGGFRGGGLCAGGSVLWSPAQGEAGQRAGRARGAAAPVQGPLVKCHRISGVRLRREPGRRWALSVLAGARRRLETCSALLA